MPYILFLDNTCYATCPTSYFGNVNTSTCDNCSSNCLTCNHTASNCLTCPADRYYNNSNNCSLCPDTCQQCTSDTACTQCINGSYIVRNGSCIVDCSPIPNCDICEIIGTTPICRNCSITYQLSDNSCVSICGDGFFAAGEECDDNNTESGDGCSLSCKLE
jgi:cysteine-rich repeat protein